MNITGKSLNASIHSVVSIAASAVTSNYFHDSVLVGLLIIGITLATMNINFRSGKKVGHTYFLSKLLILGNL